MIIYKKMGRKLLIAGMFILLVALLLLFNTTSLWALITLGMSVIMNTIGIFMLIMK